jgi:hypothetical protein
VGLIRGEPRKRHPASIVDDHLGLPLLGDEPAKLPPAVGDSHKQDNGTGLGLVKGTPAIGDQRLHGSAPPVHAKTFRLAVTATHQEHVA